MEKRPRLEYTGQSSEEILALVDTHADYSLVHALEWGLNAKCRALGGEDKLSGEERLVLAVLALEREVNNGGYKQFFWNSSRRFATTIIASLRKIDCERTAALTERALAALALPHLTVEAVTEAIQRENDDRDAALDACDREFYSFHETTPKLLRFVIEHRAHIQAPRTDDYPRRPAKKERSAADSVLQALTFKALVAKGKWNPNFDEALEAARALAKEKSIAATNRDLEAASALLALRIALNCKDLEAAGTLAPRAFELMGQNGFHIIEHRKWVEALLSAGRTEDADNASLTYLERLGSLPDEKVLKKARYWAEMLHDHRSNLPQSAQYLREHFPAIDLDNLPAPRPVLPAKELYARMKPPQLSDKE
jgi:hypothetical protein